MELTEMMGCQVRYPNNPKIHFYKHRFSGVIVTALTSIIKTSKQKPNKTKTKQNKTKQKTKQNTCILLNLSA